MKFNPLNHSLKKLYRDTRNKADANAKPKPDIDKSQEDSSVIYQSEQPKKFLDTEAPTPANIFKEDLASHIKEVKKLRESSEKTLSDILLANAFDEDSISQEVHSKLQAKKLFTLDDYSKVSKEVRQKRLKEASREFFRIMHNSNLAETGRLNSF